MRENKPFAALLASALVAVAASSACTRQAPAADAATLENQYGVSGAHVDDVPTAGGSVRGTVVPVTLADGRKADLVIPADRANDPHGVYFRDADGMHPVHLQEGATRDGVANAPAIVGRQPEPEHARKRSWEKDAVLIGGSAGAGTLIGAVAGGKKGAAVGATAGGIGGLIYDLAAKKRQ